MAKEIPITVHFPGMEDADVVAIWVQLDKVEGMINDAVAKGMGVRDLRQMFSVLNDRVTRRVIRLEVTVNEQALKMAPGVFY